MNVDLAAWEDTLVRIQADPIQKAAFQRKSAGRRTFGIGPGACILLFAGYGVLSTRSALQRRLSDATSRSQSGRVLKASSCTCSVEVNTVTDMHLSSIHSTYLDNRAS